uniref:LRAT domain-containing protein n=1 Tax=Acrobeloides nanus TaxID=290746 RepID=A0A914CL62_9BILA
MDEDHRENKAHFHWYQYYEEDKFLETEKFMSRNEAINYIKMRKSSLEKNLHKEKRQVRIYCMPKECLTNPDKYLKPGDHIQTPLSVPLINGIAHHEGIYIGDGQVIHIAIDKVSFAHGVREKGRSCARVGLLKKHFANSSDADIKVVVYRIRFKTPDEIVSNAYRYAKEFFREGEYNVLWKNCQHFASLCAVGKEEMTDKNPLIVTGLTVVGVGLAAIGGVALAAYMTGGSSNNDNDDEDD